MHECLLTDLCYNTIMCIIYGVTRESPGGLNDTLLCSVMTADSSFMQMIAIFMCKIYLESDMFQSLFPYNIEAQCLTWYGCYELQHSLAFGGNL